jgi:hypothetical protein
MLESSERRSFLAIIVDWIVSRASYKGLLEIKRSTKEIE